MRRISTLFLLLFLVFSCKPKQNMVYMADRNPSREINQAKYEGLHIQEGDILLILVSGLDEIAVRPFNLSTMDRTNAEVKASAGQAVPPSEYTVDEAGNIVFPVLGKLYVRGMTQSQLRAALEDRLHEYLTNPVVTVGLKNFNVSVLGEVKVPGQKTSETQKLNLFQALALGGDMTESGDRTHVKLIRPQENGTDMVVNLNLADAGIVTSPYYYLQQNDILYVEPDANKQIAANANPNRALWFQVGGIALAVVSLVIGLAK